MLTTEFWKKKGDAAHCFYSSLFLLKTSKADGSSQRFLFDHRNRLVRVSSWGGSYNYIGRVDYDYDTFNRKVKREDRSDSQTVIDNYFAGYDGINPTLEFEKVGGGEATRQDLQHRYWWGPQVDQLFADEQISDVSQAGEVLWALPDHLGTIRDIAKFDGTSFEIVNHRRYDSFGNLTDQTDPNYAIAFGYTGKYFDAYSGLSHHWNRWYDPAIGKWISEDPIRFAGGDTNLYRYVSNSPTHYFDPDGLILRGWWERAGQFTGQVNAFVWTGTWIDPEVASGGEILSGVGTGLVTGGKALGNGTTSAITATATLGYYNGIELFAVTENDLRYDLSKGIIQGSSELLIGIGTGGTAAALSKGNRAKQIAGGAIVSYDALGNGIGIGRGLNDVAENGITVNNSFQVLGGIAGVTGNVGGARGFEAPAPKRPVSISDGRRIHILDGDRTGGGHRPGLGKPNKSEFPAGMSDGQIIDTIMDVASAPTSVARPGRGGRTIVEGTRDGVDILVILEPDGSIVSGFPTNVPRNPRR